MQKENAFFANGLLNFLAHLLFIVVAAILTCILLNAWSALMWLYTRWYWGNPGGFPSVWRHMIDGARSDEYYQYVK